ncbi:MAG TPA: hypothetical protein VFV38_37310 [Ktedonobacteraceae bacterium]|nr:hypothetical protein [Ktedonobacteraceae bacterium]
MDTEQIKRTKALERLAEYRAGQVSESEYSSLIMQWGKARLLEARSDIEAFLQHPNASLRRDALDALGFLFRLQDYWPTATQFLLYDPEYQVRTMGASTLAALKANSGDRQTLGVLASVVADSYDYELIRTDAYRAMFVVAYGYQQADVHWEEIDNPPEKIFDLQRDINWNFVNECIDPALQEEWHAEAQTLLKHYRAGQVAEQNYYSMLRKFGRAKLQEARQVVEDFLESAIPLLRTTALRVLLLYLQIPGNKQIAIDMFQHDPNKDKRLAALEVLSQLLRGTRDKATLRVLYPLAYDREWGADVFAAILKIYPGDFGEIKDYLTSPDEETR